MRPTRLILTLTLVVTLLTPVHAGPPAPFSPKSKAFTPPKFVPGARPATPRIQPRFVPPQSLGGRGNGPISGGSRPPVSSFRPPVVNPRPPVVNPRPPVANLRPPVVVPQVIPGGAQRPANGPGGVRPMNVPAGFLPGDRNPLVRDDLEPRDSDGDGVPDIRDPDRFDPGLVDREDGRGADPAVPADPAPPVADAGPTAWDWVAIGLAAAAFVDGRADRRGGFSPDSGVVIERPLVQTVPADPIIVHHEVVSATPAPGVETVVISEPVHPAGPTVEDSAAADSATTASTEPLPQLRVGEGFQLPATGLGGSQGRVAVKVGVVILECPVSVWNETGLAAAVPATTLEAATRADLIVALADGKVAAVVPVELLPARPPVAATK